MQNTTIDHSTVPLPSLDESEAPVSSLCALFNCAVATAPDAGALRHSGVTLTYREMGRAVSALVRRQPNGNDNTASVNDSTSNSLVVLS